MIFCLRYILEELDEAGMLAIDAAGDIANGALTEYRVGNKGLMLTRFNDITPLVGTGATVTVAREPIAAARG